jgi:hypothetical protein
MKELKTRRKMSENRCGKNDKTETEEKSKTEEKLGPETLHIFPRLKLDESQTSCFREQFV